MEITNKNEYMSVAELAARLSVAISTVQRWARKDPEVQVFTVKWRNRYYFHKPGLEVWMRAQNIA